MKVIYCGLESRGKTLFLARILRELVERNRNWERKYGFRREVWTNIKVGVEFSSRWSHFLHFWKDYREVVGVPGIDVLWDEISSDLSALKTEPLPRNVNRWLRQGAKQGVHIYATAQEFHDVHLQMRRRFWEAWKVHKLIGSGRGGKNLPPVRVIWGLCYARRLEIEPYNELAPVEYGFPQLLFFGRGLCETFDTYQLIKEAEVQPPYEHLERTCPDCGFKKIYHK